MPPTALLILLLAGIVFLSARLYASPHSRGGGQVGGLTFEAEPVRRHQPIALVVAVFAPPGSRSDPGGDGDPLGTRG